MFTFNTQVEGDFGSMAENAEETITLIRGNDATRLVKKHDRNIGKSFGGKQELLHEKSPRTDDMDRFKEQAHHWAENESYSIIRRLKSQVFAIKKGRG